jgi:predicted AAA+ superfamily ATPase
LKASELLNCNNLLVITWDYEDEITVENRKIVFKPLWKWLLTSLAFKGGAKISKFL